MALKWEIFLDRPGDAVGTAGWEGWHQSAAAQHCSGTLSTNRRGKGKGKKAPSPSHLLEHSHSSSLGEFDTDPEVFPQEQVNAKPGGNWGRERANLASLRSNWSTAQWHNLPALIFKAAVLINYPLNPSLPFRSSLSPLRGPAECKEWPVTVFFLTIYIGNSNELEDRNDDKGIRSCISVHKL